MTARLRRGAIAISERGEDVAIVATLRMAREARCGRLRRLERMIDATVADELVEAPTARVAKTRAVPHHDVYELTVANLRRRAA